MSPIPSDLPRLEINRLPTTCSLSQTSLEECALLMEPARTYTLYVAPRLQVFAQMLVKDIGATTKNHPFAPLINVIVLDNLAPHGWYIKGAYHEAWGSEGL